MKDSKVLFIITILTGLVAKLFASEAVYLFLLILTGFFLHAVWLNYITTTTTTEKNDAILRPNTEARIAQNKSNKNYLIAGDFIETTPHPNLDTAIRLVDAGWHPSDIKVYLEDNKFDAEEILRLSGGIKEFDPPNGTKYALVSDPFVTEESPQLELFLRETDYFTIRTVKEFFGKKPELKSKYGSVVLRENRIPSSLCLHYIIRTSNGDFLCMRRAIGMAWHNGMWSFTGEEQISEHDIAQQRPIEKLFKRALCEEIFQLRNSKAPQEVISLLEEDLQFIRILSVGIEFPLYNPAIIGLTQLSINTVELRRKLVERKKDISVGAGSDNEGDFFIMSKIEALNLLLHGRASVVGLFNQEKVENITPELLHPTSRYRLYRTLKIITHNNFR